MSSSDSCWLSKSLEGYTFTLHGLKEEVIIKTIRQEMQQLFSAKEELEDKAQIIFRLVQDKQLGSEGYTISKEKERYFIDAQTEIGCLYGLFGFYQKIVLKQSNFPLESIPDQSIRMINHWDNMDGTIERGYAGESIFFKDNQFRRDKQRVKEYARLLASVGINAISINNVNVHSVETNLITEEFLPEVKEISDIFNSYGIKTYLSINFASPKLIGKLSTADPLDEKVIAFWKETIETIYAWMPSFGGFLVKADSEGEPGPFAYGRGHDEGANLFGRLLAPYGGHCIWRCFVYNHQQDWRDRSIDRARAAYDHFMPLDGLFLENVTLQIKLGPLDFQVREPISPLFGALRQTNHIIEFQLTQEYTGHQKALYYQVPVWKEALEFDCHYPESPGRVKELIKKNSPKASYSGISAVGVVGTDSNWTGHKLMQSNWYAYGRLTWNNQLTENEIIADWISLTFTLPEDLQNVLAEMLLSSRETYSLYTAPRGVGFMVKPHVHDGPDIDGYEYDKWGTYHFADRNGLGNDRTMDGTKYVEQYSEKVCAQYNSLETCPDELLLWFHYVPYDHIMHNGKTLIQDIYDTHFEGVHRVQIYQEQWKPFKDFVEPVDYDNVKDRLKHQLALSIEWRDQINTYFYRKSGVKDQDNRKIYS